MAIEAKLISEGRDGKRAQVVVYLGEGAQRRSVTRHVHLKGPGYLWGVGRNIDEAGLARLDAAEEALSRAEQQYEFLERFASVSIKEIDEMLGKISRCREAIRELPPVFQDAVQEALLMESLLKEKAGTESVKAIIENHVVESVAFLQTARKQVEELRQEIPRYVEFKW